MGRGHDQQAGQAIEDEGEKEEHQAKFDERMQSKIGGGLGEFVGDAGGDGIAGRKKRSANDGGIADDHGDGHGFAEGAREGQEDGAKDARAGEGNDHLPGGFPAGSPEREGGFALVARDGEEHFTRDGNNVGDDHDGENNAGSQKTHAIGWPLEEREETEGALEGRLNELAHQWDDDEDAEDAVDNAGDGGQKINEKFGRGRNSCGSELGKKNGRADAEGNGDEQRNCCGDERDVNEGQSAELTEDGIPDGGTEKVEAKLVAGGGRA